MSQSLIKLCGACLLLCLLGLGCAHAPKSTARSGPYPENYKEIVSKWLDVYLAFPQDVKDVQASKPQFFENEHDAGYSVLVMYTPKTMDSRNGLRHMVPITIRDGQVVGYGEPVAGKEIHFYGTMPAPRGFRSRLE